MKPNMTPLAPPAHDCPDCTSGFVIRICRVCDLTGWRERGGDIHDCTFCAGDGVTRHVCDCCVYGVPSAWGKGGIPMNVRAPHDMNGAPNPTRTTVTQTLRSIKGHPMTWRRAAAAILIAVGWW